mmetsp:Transcript_64725/g.204358  ORF Transcript_64725/g.204358 Transcript_64725/m.204358 type:complete len:1065 (-) Transcript_64725:60-3254(-)
MSRGKQEPAMSSGEVAHLSSMMSTGVNIPGGAGARNTKNNAVAPSDRPRPNTNYGMLSTAVSSFDMWSKPGMKANGDRASTMMAKSKPPAGEASAGAASLQFKTSVTLNGRDPTAYSMLFVDHGAPEDDTVPEDLDDWDNLQEKQAIGGAAGGGKMRRMSSMTASDMKQVLNAQLKIKYTRFKPQGGGMKFLINPRSRFFRNWDIMLTLLLVTVSLLTPFEISFIETGTYSAFFYINRFIDIFFLVDMIFNFFLPFIDKEQKWVVSWHEISRRYLKTWFPIDLVSVFPFELIYVAGGTGVANLHVLRLVRCLRLLKMLRVLRAERLWRRWEATFSMDYATIAMMKFIVIMIFLTHIMGCGFHLVQVLEKGDGVDPEDTIGRTNWVLYYSFVDETSSVWSRYMLSMYWSTATLTTLGYGDVVPTTDWERAYCLMAAVIGASMYGYVIGGVSSIINGANKRTAQFYRTMDALNHFVREKHVPDALAMRLRDFFRFCRAHYGLNEQQGLLLAMSPSLRSEVAKHIHYRWLTLVPAFKDLSDDFITSIALNLYSETYGNDEVVIALGSAALEMFIVEKGILSVTPPPKIVSKGGTIGEDMIFRIEEMRRSYAATTLTNTIVLVLDKSDLIEVLRSHPEDAVVLRKYIIKLLFRNTVFAYSTTVMHLEKIHGDRNSWYPGTSLFKGLDAGTLPIVYIYVLERMYQEDVADYWRFLGAVETVQRVARMWSRNRRRNMKRFIVELEDREFLPVGRLLYKAYLEEHTALLKRHKVTWWTLADCTVESLVAIGMPLGHAARLYHAYQEEMSDPNKARSSSVVRVGNDDTEILARNRPPPDEQEAAISVHSTKSRAVGVHNKAGSIISAMSAPASSFRQIQGVKSGMDGAGGASAGQHRPFASANEEGEEGVVEEFPDMPSLPTLKASAKRIARSMSSLSARSGSSFIRASAGTVLAETPGGRSIPGTPFTPVQTIYDCVEMPGSEVVTETPKKQQPRRSNPSGLSPSGVRRQSSMVAAVMPRRGSNGTGSNQQMHAMAIAGGGDRAMAATLTTIPSMRKMQAQQRRSILDLIR